VFSIQRREYIKEKNKHPTILNIPDELWNELKTIFPKEKHLKTVGRPIIPYRKVIDGNLYVLRTEDASGKYYQKNTDRGSTRHRRFQQWNRLDVFKKGWIRILKIYDDCIGINWTWQSIIDSKSIKSPLEGEDCRK
jgi:transposase